MSKTLSIKSRIGDYGVQFTDDFLAHLRADTKKRRSFLIIDENVYRLYQKKLQPFVRANPAMIVRAVEPNKSFAGSRKLIDFLLTHNFKRNDWIIAIGGGIIQDIAGFTASILFRGVAWVFYPTTLLAQADSCIGSKNCVNVGKFKNQLGTFYPPAHIVLDTHFLKSLDHADILSGMGEIIKFSLLDGRKSFAVVARAYDKALKDQATLCRLIFHTLKLKKKLIEIDEFDRGIRNIFNYGHTFGHAIESITNYRVRHGQAITLGMDMANFISVRKGMLKQGDFAAMSAVIRKNSPRFHLSAGKKKAYFLSLSKDKKNIGRQLTCILMRGPGRAVKISLPFDGELKQAIRDYFALTRKRR